MTLNDLISCLSLGLVFLMVNNKSNICSNYLDKQGAISYYTPAGCRVDLKGIICKRLNYLYERDYVLKTIS